MKNDIQPRLAILGAGPIGLEAALYARYLGYIAELFEQGQLPAERVHKDGQKMLDGPFSAHASSLGVAALKAQDSKWRCPAGAAKLSVEEYYRAYLKPLAESDLVAESLRLEMEAQSVSRVAEDGWRISCRSPTGHDSEFAADVVIDTTGLGSEAFVEEEGSSMEPLSFLNPVADFYVLGGKSCETGKTFQFATGLGQIRELFAILGERDDLDVYATMPPIES